MPYDVAFNLSDEDRTVYSIIIGELEGNKFDWNLLRWREQK